MVVLDSDFVIAVLKNDAAALHKLSLLQHERLCITSTTAFELLRGVYRLPNPERRRAMLIDVISSMYILDFTYFEADAAARIEADLTKAGTPIGTLDVFIAASCLTVKERIVTRNQKHFARIEGLIVEGW